MMRKVQLDADGDTTDIALYEYYPDNRRSEKIVQNLGDEETPNDGGNTTVRFYYAGVAQPPSAAVAQSPSAAVAQSPSTAVAQSPSTANWPIIETRNGSNQTTFQYLWAGMGGPGVSPGSYVDELIWIEKNGDPTESNDTDPDDQTGESTADQRYFVHQDRNWNVTALSEYDTGDSNNGRIVERYSYTSYGQFVVLEGDSGNGELASGSLTSTIGNVFAHQGLPIDQENGSYQNRWREYAPQLARFLQRDPAGFIDGPNMYNYVTSNPVTRTDPTGQCWAGCYSCTFATGACTIYWGFIRTCTRTCILVDCHTGTCPPTTTHVTKPWAPCWCPTCNPGGGTRLMSCVEGGSCSQGC